MQTFRLIVSLGLGALALYIIWQVVSAYRSATGTTWQRLLATGKQSATILWGKFSVVIAGLAGFLGDFADTLGAPGVKDTIQNALAKPVYVALFVVGISLVSMLARKRTL
jgi:hypothetical protein